MKKETGWRSGLALASALLAASIAEPAFAYLHGGSWSGSRSNWSYHGAHGSASGGGGSWSGSTNRGGSASGGGGSWNATGYRGGTASGGEGNWHATGASGGTASGGGGTWHATGANGSTASGSPTYRGGNYYYGYHPPTVINNYGAGCYNCGGWNAGSAWAAGVTGAAVGATVGAAAASSANAAANANAYSAGYAAGATSAYAMGSVYPSLPPGCVYSPYSGVTYYKCGQIWFSPYYGANGMYYRVVPTP